MSTTQAQTRPEWVDDDLFPFESRFVELLGNSVHYIDEGAGPVLLMLHGNPTWSFVYRDVIRALRDDFRCIALDYPGFGLSTAAPEYHYLPQDHAEVVQAFVEHLDLHEVTLIAQDWGGPIGLTVAERVPERFGRLVMANTWAWPVNGDRHFEFFSRMMGGFLGRALVRHVNLFVNAMIPMGHRLRNVTSTEMGQYRKALPTAQRRNAAAVLPEQILGARPFLEQVQQNLPKIDNLPTLIIWADKDIAFRDVELQRLKQTFPNHTVAMVPGGGHYVQSDAPDQVADAIRAWFS